MTSAKAGLVLEFLSKAVVLTIPSSNASKTKAMPNSNKGSINISCKNIQFVDCHTYLGTDKGVGEVSAGPTKIRKDGDTYVLPADIDPRTYK